MTPVDGAHVDALLDDLEEATRDFLARFDRDPTLAARAKPGGWNGARHADHVARALGLFAELLEGAEHDLRAGRLGRRAGRGPLQWLFVRLAVHGKKFPRGARAPKAIEPGHPEGVEAAREEIPRAVARYRALAARLAPAERDALWIRNPFIRRWHYRLPEAIRLQAQHTRHHGMLVDEIG